MQAQAAFRSRRMSLGPLVVVIALLITFLVGGASGYIVKALTVPAATSAPAFTTVQSTSRNGGPAGQVGDEQQPLPQRTILPNRT